MGIVQGLIFGMVVLFDNRYSSKTNSFLAYTAFSLSLSNLQYWFYDSELYKIYPLLDWLRIPCEFLIIPMFFLFVNSYLEINISRKIKILVIIPFIADFICQIIVTFFTYTYPNDFFKKNILYKYLLIEESFSFIYSTILILLTLIIVKKYEINNKHFNLKKVVAETIWIKKILLIGLLCCIFWVIEIYVMIDNINKGTSIYYPLWISISIIIYWLSYVGLSHSSIFNERKIIRQNFIAERNNKQKESKIIKNKTHDKILEDFENWVKNLYLNPNLNLDMIAEKIGISNSYLSQIINNRNIKFNEYLNSIRVEKAKEMLKDKSFKSYTITSIGLEAGFNSNASFYRAFKKNTNSSPKDFRNNL